MFKTACWYQIVSIIHYKIMTFMLGNSNGQSTQIIIEINNALKTFYNKDD